VAIFFPLLVSGLFYLSYGRWREWVRAIFDPWGLLIFVAIVLPWHVAIYLDSGWQFFKGFYLHQNIGRYDSPMEGHSGGIFYYVIAAPLIIMPFAGWLIESLRQLPKVRIEPLDRFVWLWFFSVLVVFSFSGTKLPHYMLYGVTGVVLLMARYRDGLRSPWLGFVPAVLFLGVLSALPQLFATLAQTTGRDYDRGLFEAGAQSFSGWPQLLCVSALLMALLILFLPLTVWRRLLLIGYVQAALVAGLIVPTVLDVLQAGPKAAGLFAREQEKDVVFYRVYQPSVSVYRQQVTTHAPAKPGQWVYVRADHVAEYLAEPSPYRKHIVFSQPPATLIAVDEKAGD
jgi:4-amino-4-deoxy-L-arabinose transferase-like glycosyltransferase